MSPYTHKYKNLCDANFTDLNSLPAEANLYLQKCLFSIKQDIDFVSNFEEIYNFRPEFSVNFINSIDKKDVAFAHIDNTYQKCFIYISVGLIFTVHNILCEAISLEPNFLSTCFSDTCHHIHKNIKQKIRTTTKYPTSIDSLINRFCEYREKSIEEDKKNVIDGIVLTAISYICKHEMAHFFRTHFTFSHNSNYVTCFEEGSAHLLFKVDSPKNKWDTYMRAMESDADTQATIMTLREVEFILTNDYTIEKISQKDALDLYYEFGLAIGILFLYLDKKVDFKNRSIGTHPPSVIRLQNILYIMKIYFETIYHIDPENIIEEQMAILYELENLAILLGFSDGLWIRYDSPQYKNLYLDIGGIEDYWNKTYPDMLEILKKIDQHALYDFINLNLS